MNVSDIEVAPIWCVTNVKISIDSLLPESLQKKYRNTS